MVDCIPLRRTPTSLESLIRSVVALMQPYASEMQVDLRIAVDASLPTSITVDADKIAWTLGMLIGNALRHVRRGSMFRQGGEIVIRAAADAGTHDFVIEVADDGPGIAPDVVQQLFDLTTGARPGYAVMLGREILIAHGGMLDVTSSQDPDAHGTTVRLSLPAAEAR